MSFLESMLEEIAVDVCRLSVVDRCRKQFEPHGITICLLLSESHISIHTWPESGAFAVDVYSCRETLDPQSIRDAVERKLPIRTIQVRNFERRLDASE